jgi:class 3 adenylate cyclase
MWFERAVNDARARGADAELAATAREYGRFLHARGDAKADDLFAIARSTANELMHPVSSGAVTRAVLVTDLVASTALNSRLGDREYVALLREHDVVIRRQLARHDGVEFKHTGDGIAAWFFSIDGALRCACAVREEFAQSAHESQSLLQVKIALSVGEPIVVEGDLIGLSVTKAFRALEGAYAGEILATDEVVERSGSVAYTFESRGPRELKGFPAPVDLFAVSLSEMNV